MSSSVRGCNSVRKANWRMHGRLALLATCSSSPCCLFQRYRVSSNVRDLPAIRHRTVNRGGLGRRAGWKRRTAVQEAHTAPRGAAHRSRAITTKESVDEWTPPRARGSGASSAMPSPLETGDCRPRRVAAGDSSCSSANRCGRSSAQRQKVTVGATFDRCVVRSRLSPG